MEQDVTFAREGCRKEEKKGEALRNVRRGDLKGCHLPRPDGEPF